MVWGIVCASVVCVYVAEYECVREGESVCVRANLRPRPYMYMSQLTLCGISIFVGVLGELLRSILCWHDGATLRLQLLALLREHTPQQSTAKHTSCPFFIFCEWCMGDHFSSWKAIMKKSSISCMFAACDLRFDMCMRLDSSNAVPISCSSKAFLTQEIEHDSTAMLLQQLLRGQKLFFFDVSRHIKKSQLRSVLCV